MLAALALGALSGAGSIISGLGARSSAKSQARHQAAIDAANLARKEALGQYYGEASQEYLARYDRDIADVPRRLVSDAYAAGFNPQTWLNAGALGFYQGYATDRLSVGSNMLSNKYSMLDFNLSDAQKIPSVGEAIGAGVSSFASAFGTQYRADEKLAFESSALDRQLAAVSSRLAARPGATNAGMAALSGTGGPLYAAGSVASQRGVGGLSSNAQGDFKIKSTQVFPWLPNDKTSPDSQSVSDRYGEWGEDISGLYNFGNDLSLKYTKKTLPEFAVGAIPKGVDMADFFSMDFARNRKFFADYFQPATGPRIEWNNPFANPYAAPPAMQTGGGF